MLRLCIVVAFVIVVVIAFVVFALAFGLRFLIHKLSFCCNCLDMKIDKPRLPDSLRTEVRVFNFLSQRYRLKRSYVMKLNIGIVLN